MLRSLLIGVNGSEWSRAAVEIGLGWARGSNVSVTFLGIVDVEGITGGESVPAGAGGFKAERDAKLVAAARDRVESALGEATARAAELGVEARAHVVEGPPPERLGQEMQRHDLLLIGKRAVPKTDRDPAPSETMTEILHQAARPIVVTSGPASDAAPVLIAYDGSIQAARTLKSFVNSGLYAAHPTHIVGVSDNQEEMREKLRRASDFLAAHGREAETHALSVGSGVPETLHDYIDRVSPKLLVMGVYGQSRVKEMLFGSVTRTLLDTVHVPMFLDR